MRLSDLWNKVKSTPTFKPAHFEIPFDRTDVSQRPQTPFQPKDQYFEVAVNELYLTYKRNWFKEYDPVVYIVSEFIYEREKHTVPFVVGPSLMEGKLDKLPDGMIFENIKVAGLHPYRGGDFSLGVVLARSKRIDYLRHIIKIITDTAATYTGSFATIVTQYSKIADVVINSIDALFDNKDVEPLIGYYRTYSSGQNAFTPGYHVIVNEDESSVDEKKFFVRKNRLHYGDEMSTAQPYRSDDYVLYSVMASNERTDTDLLTFANQFYALQDMIKGMHEIGENEKKIIAAKLHAIQDGIRMSPDLVRQQMQTLIDDYWSEIKQIISDRKSLSGPQMMGKSAKDPWEQAMDDKALQMLNSPF